ncbi:hypothetical protein M2271_008474 [Streptomyces sp. LBL]|nr:hypothetical protein [Streptomyces sp. LBL]
MFVTGLRAHLGLLNLGERTASRSATISGFRPDALPGEGIERVRASQTQAIPPQLGSAFCRALDTADAW